MRRSNRFASSPLTIQIFISYRLSHTIFMASLQIVRSGCSQFTAYRSELGRKMTFCSSELDSDSRTRRIVRFQWRRSLVFPANRGFRVCCGVKEGDDQRNGEEPPESLFMKELRRRGMTPTSLLEDSNRSVYGTDEDVKVKEDDRGFSTRITSDLEKSISNQRERSMALNSEGLEGLIPRAKLLLTIGGTFFLGFGPLILITIIVFSALYFYFGPTFIHDATNVPTGPPPYIDPYALLEDERITQMVPRVK